jgi:glycosyltransferase involved in cell wall biosynthesis
MATKPLVSVVTPFFNSEPYLAECIESVLKQSYSEFEYILMDNCSNDGSYELAKSYETRDHRIRLLKCSEFVPQLNNYNRVLREISDASQYCKIVQADDYILPNCLELMLQSFEQSVSIGLVSSYRSLGDQVGGAGYPYRKPMLSGKECGQFFLRTGNNIFGSQTTVMYRSSVVRSDQQFYNETLPHSDLDKAMEILERWDFGFVHQLLSFSRVDNESISSSLQSFEPYSLDRYIIAEHHAPTFMEAAEAAHVIRSHKLAYYRVLAREALRFRDGTFWQYHMDGLSTVGQTLDLRYLTVQIALKLLWEASNPGRAITRTLRALNWKREASVGAPAHEERTVQKNVTTPQL